MENSRKKATLAEALTALRGLTCSRADDMQAAAYMDDSIEELQLAEALNNELDACLSGLGWTRAELVQELAQTAATRTVLERLNDSQRCSQLTDVGTI